MISSSNNSEHNEKAELTEKEKNEKEYIESLIVGKV